MYKPFSKIVIILTIIFSLNITAYAAQTNTIIYSKPPSVNGGSAILINAQTGQIIYEKNPYTIHYPASTTKILTALLTVEHLNPNKILTVSKSACSIPGDSSSIGLKAGEQMSVNNLLHALLLNSANESANTLAEGVSGSIPAFVKLMNERAKELGAKNSNFVTPHGYHNPKHYTTAYDLSRIAMAAMKNPLLRDIVKTQIYKIPPTNIHKTGIYLSNTNKLINSYRGKTYFYPYAEGIKTGYTGPAKHTLISAAKKGNIELISVVLFSDDAFKDTINLFNYGFNNFKSVLLLKKDTILKSISIKNGNTPLKLGAKNDLSYIQKLNTHIESSYTVSYKKLTLPIKKDQIVAEAVYSVNNEVIGTVPLYAVNNVHKVNIIKRFANSTIKNIPYILGGLAIVCILILMSLLSLKRKKFNYK